MIPTTFDNSMLTAFRQCERLFYNRYIMGYRESENVNLHAGKCHAAALEAARWAFYRDGASEEEAFEIGAKRLVEEWGDPMKFADEVKNLRRMLEVFEAYMVEYPLSETEIARVDGMPLVETHFDYPFGQYRYCGTPDAVIEYGGGLWLVDEKTTGSTLNGQWAAQWKRHGQFSGYAWGLKEHGIQIDGVLVRGIGIQKTQTRFLEVATPRPQWMIDEWEREATRTIDAITNRCNTAYWGCSIGDACTKFGRECDFLPQCCSPAPDYSKFKVGKWYPMYREWRTTEGDEN